MSKAIARRKPSAAAVAQVRNHTLTKILEDIATDDAALCVTAKRGGRELDNVEHGRALLAKSDDDLAALGWNRADLRVAIDGKQNSKEVPYYLKMAQERTVMRFRDGHGESPAASNRPMVVLMPVYQASRRDEAAPVIEVSEAGTK